MLGDAFLQGDDFGQGLAGGAQVATQELEHLLHLRDGLAQLMFLRQEGVGVALGLADLLDGLGGQLAQLGHFLGSGFQRAGVSQPGADFFGQQFLGDLAGLLRHVFAGAFEFAAESRHFGFLVGQLGLQDLQGGRLGGGLLGGFLRLAGAFHADLPNLGVLRLEFVGVLAADLAAFVFAGRFALGNFSQETPDGLAGRVERVDRLEGFFFRGPAQLGL